MSKEDIQESFYELAPLLVDVEPDSEGRITYSGRSFVFFQTKLFANLFENMEEVAGPVIRSRIKEFGEKAGFDIAEKMDEEFKDPGTLKKLKLLFKSGFDLENLKSINKTGNLESINKILGYGRFVGWGGKTKIEEYEEGEKVVFKEYNTFESYSHRKSDSQKQKCKFLQGVMKGIMSFYWEKDVEVEETQCVGVNPDNKACRLVVESAD